MRAPSGDRPVPLGEPLGLPPRVPPALRLGPQQPPLPAHVALLLHGLALLPGVPHRLTRPGCGLAPSGRCAVTAAQWRTSEDPVAMLLGPARPYLMPAGEPWRA